MLTAGDHPAPIDSTHGRGRRRATADRADLACPTCRRVNTTHPQGPPAQGAPRRSSHCALPVSRRCEVCVSHTDRAWRCALRRSSTAHGRQPAEKVRRHDLEGTDRRSNALNGHKTNATDIITHQQCLLYYTILSYIVGRSMVLCVDQKDGPKDGGPKPRSPPTIITTYVHRTRGGR